MRSLIRNLPLISLFSFARMAVVAAMSFVLFTSAIAFASADAGVAEETLVEGAVKSFQETSHSVRTIASNPSSPKILIVLVMLIGVAQLFRRVGRKLPVIRGFHLGTWLDQNWWADWVVSIVMSVGGAVITAASGGDAIDLGLIVNALVLGMAGAGFGPGAAKPSVSGAAAAGAAAAADPNKTLNG